jgi:hypothetical protein
VDVVEYLPSVITVFAASYAFTYARWLKQHGNMVGAMGVFFIVMVGLAISVYRQVTRL